GSGDSSLSLEKKSVSRSRSKSKSLPSQPESRTTAATAAPKGARGVDGISRMGGVRVGERREQRKDPGGGHTQLSKFSGVGSSDGDVCFSAKPENRFIRPGVCAWSVVDRTWDGPHAVDAGHQQARFWVSGRGGGC